MDSNWRERSTRHGSITNQSYSNSASSAGGESMNTPSPLRLSKETDEDKSAYYNKEAASHRQELVNHQVSMYLERGGKITRLPAYDEPKP